MSASGYRVLRKMNVWCLILSKLLLLQMLVTCCGAKHVAIDSLPKLQYLNEADVDVQDSIRNLMHTGIYSHRHLDSSEVQVVTPVKVTFDGELVSTTVDHEHGHGHARARRDLHQTEHLLPHTLHYNLTVDGRDLRLDLRPSVTFITPALVIERHEASGRTRHRPHPASTSCHYTGVIRGQPASNIALSACDGLAGLLRTENGEYWIEPSNQDVNDIDSPGGRPHVIFRRSAVDKVKAYHRAKRSLETTQKQVRRNENSRRRESQEAIDRRRREYLEARSRRLESLRRNPTEYRRQQMRLRMEQRRKEYSSKSSSLQSNSESIEQALIRNKTEHRNRGMHHPKPRRIRPRRRRKKRSKNCATKQPPYQWKKKNHVEQEKSEYNHQHSRYSNHHRLPNKTAFNNTRRSARSVSKPRHVEVLLVADKSMTSFHNKSNIETYLLTIMNMVSSLYMDPSIGNYIKVVVVKIILVKEVNAAPELEISTNADQTLASFCQWQQQLNPEDDNNPHHHDVAILITRQDICSRHDIPCSTLGVAHVAGMCKPERSCSVNEDNGIMLAHTITHELGHNFGLYHDTEKIGCRRREGSTLHIMTPIFEADTRQVAWSRCSKRDVTNFLDAGMGECLGDRPSQEEYVYPEVPAGVTFDAANQCHLEFGAEAVVCADPAELCEHLWCLVNNTCKTMLRPAAPGTTCGPDMWCQDQKCVARVPSPAPRDGGWGSWSEWSECSRTCGAGVSTQYRRCDNPEPLNNGNYCIGDRSRYKVCNTEPCSINEPTFREVQCSKFANTTYNNETIEDWVPYFDQDKPCELKCIPKDRNIDVELSSGFAADGTPCRQSPSTRDMCIEGVCYKVGCDWIVDSNLEEDACGMCGGDGTACNTVQGIYNKDTTKQSGFSEVAVIPAGSKNVRIQEKVNPGNYISIGSAKTRKVYLNGARNATLSEYFVAGSQAIYERDRDWEKVRIPGPIAEDIKVFQRIYRGRHRNPGVTYQYTVDRPAVDRRRRYRLSDWTPCSVTCGLGHARRYLQCLDDHDRVLDMSQCSHIEQPRQEALMQQCRMQACPVPSHAHWWVGPWDHCSDRHHKGGELSKQRSVYCVDKTTNTVIDESKCDRATRPINRISCGETPR